MKVIAQNKKAFFDYEILDKLEAGVVLTGDEVKSLRAGQASLIGSFAVVKGSELFLINCNISTYKQAYDKREDYSTRSRKLLLHRRELARLIGDISKKGITLVPLMLYFNKNNMVKVEIGVCKHKKAAAKKETIKERDIARQTRRELKDVYKY
jgi:SsrA-binding protein